MSTKTQISYVRVGFVMIVSLIIASAWLVFPYMIQGRQLLSDVGDTARMTKGGRVSMYLTRYLVDHPKLELTATFATDEFFQYVDRAQVIGDLRPDRNFIFYVSENIHEGELAVDLPRVELHLNDNTFSGPIVSIFERLPRLQLLNLYHNELTSLPADIGLATNLETLSIGNNRFAGTIPTELGLLVNLKGLFLNDNKMRSTIPSQLGSLTNLQDGLG